MLVALAAAFLMASPVIASQSMGAAFVSHCEGGGGNASHHEDRSTPSLACCVATAASVAPAMAEIATVDLAPMGEPVFRSDGKIPGGNWGTDPPPPRLA